MSYSCPTHGNVGCTCPSPGQFERELKAAREGGKKLAADFDELRKGDGKVCLKCKKEHVTFNDLHACRRLKETNMSLVTPNGEPHRDWSGAEILVCPKCKHHAYHYAETVILGQPDPNHYRCGTCLHFYTPTPKTLVLP